MPRRPATSGGAGTVAADRLGVSTPSCQDRQRWHVGDLVLVQMLPEDPWRSVRLSAPDGLVRCDDEVHPEVVDGFGKGLVHHLKWVNRGGQDCVWPKHAGLDQQGDF